MGGIGREWKNSGQPKSPSKLIWWMGDEPVILDRSSDIAMTENSLFSMQSSFMNSTSYMEENFSGLNTPQRNGKVIMVPARGSETPITRAKMPGIRGCSTPEVRHKIDDASADNLKEVTMKLFKVLKRNGLTEDAEKAFRYLRQGAKLGSDSQDLESGVKNDEELLGMDYLLKDGIISYLRDFARITPPIPQQVVRFSGIKYSARVELSNPGYETFGKKLLGCFLAPFGSFYKKNKTVQVRILQDIDGYIMPGSMTLLLGPPVLWIWCKQTVSDLLSIVAICAGSGKSSLLKILAGRAEEAKNMSLEGVVLYDDKQASQIVLSRLIAYINGQLNKHIPFLSVRETLEFARDCTQALRPENFTPQMRKFFAHALVEKQDPFLEYVLEILDLKVVEGELVGVVQDGVTENDREKLTTAELALGTYAVMLYDQPCSGHDYLATFDLVNTLRSISRIQQSSLVVEHPKPTFH